jgi:hypothetical protein
MPESTWHPKASNYIMPRENIDSLNRTREFLRTLLDPKKTPRIPKAIREEASSCLHHYPFECHSDAILCGLMHYYKMQGVLEMFDSMEDSEDCLLSEFELVAKEKVSDKKMVDVQIDLTDEEFLLIARAAHRERISLGGWVNLVLTEVLTGDMESPQGEQNE